MVGDDEGEGEGEDEDGHQRRSRVGDQPSRGNLWHREFGNCAAKAKTMSNLYHIYCNALWHWQQAEIRMRTQDKGDRVPKDEEKRKRSNKARRMTHKGSSVCARARSLSQRWTHLEVALEVNCQITYACCRVDSILSEKLSAGNSTQLNYLNSLMSGVDCESFALTFG